MDERFYTKALRFLQLRPRTEKEVKDNLLKYKAPKDQIEIIINKLKEQKFLNDEEFAKWWIEQREKFRPKGWSLVEIELRNKGISKEIIQNLRFKNKDLREDKELAKAKVLIQKNLKKFQGLSREKLFQKLGGFLTRRGFGYEIVKTCIDELYQK